MCLFTIQGTFKIRTTTEFVETKCGTTAAKISICTSPTKLGSFLWKNGTMPIKTVGFKLWNRSCRCWSCNRRTGSTRTGRSPVPECPHSERQSVESNARKAVVEKTYVGACAARERAAIEMPVELVEHVAQPLAALLARVQQDGLEVHRQAVPARVDLVLPQPTTWSFKPEDRLDEYS